MDDPFEPDANQEKIRELVEELRERTEKIGLYMQEVHVAGSDPEAIHALQERKTSLKDILDGESELVIMASFLVGEQAFSTRVTNPTQHEIDRQARNMLPSEAELIIEKIKRAQEEGKGIFDDE